METYRGFQWAGVNQGRNATAAEDLSCRSSARNRGTCHRVGAATVVPRAADWAPAAGGTFALVALGIGVSSALRILAL